MSSFCLHEYTFEIYHEKVCLNAMLFKTKIENPRMFPKLAQLFYLRAIIHHTAFLVFLGHAQQ